MPTRRNLLVALGGASAVGGMFGTGAFQAIVANRDATVEVKGDGSSALAFEVKDPRYASLNNGVFELDVEDFGTTGNATGNRSLNNRAITRLAPVFGITNQGSKDLELTIKTHDKNGNPVNSVALFAIEYQNGSGEIDNSQTEIGEYENANNERLDAGVEKRIGVEVNTNETDDPTTLNTVVITAEEGS